MADLFGMETGEPGDSLPLKQARELLFVLTNPRPRGKHYVEPRGYAAMPGTGPADKKCKGCAFYCHKGGVAGSYPKCRKVQAKWTGGRVSDILANAPACSQFQEPEIPL